MHPSFSDWYRAIRTKLNADELKSRWQVVEALAAKLDLPQAAEFLRTMFELPTITTNFQQELAARVHEIDPTFSQKNSKLELSILAAGALSELMKQKATKLSDQAAMAIVSVAGNGLLAKNLPHQSGVIEEAINYQLHRATILRKPDQLLFSKTGVSKLKEATTAFLAPLNWQPHQERFDAPFNLLNDGLRTQSEKIARLQYELRLQREESNILWWLHGECSRDLNQPFIELGASASTIMAGKELADLIDIRPGPPSAKGVLYRLLHKVVLPSAAKKASDSLTLRDAINATPRKWRERWTNNLRLDDVSDLCHVHHAAQKSLQVAEGKAWAAAFDAAAPIKASQKFSPLELAIQVYQEAQLIAEVKG